MSSSPALILVDGMPVLYRAFYAIKNLSTSAGRPTNAVYGFIRALRQIVDVRKPTHIAVVFDGGLPAERVAVLPEYKAQRPEMPDALREQIDTVQEYLDRAGVAWCRQDGCEADDIIASIAAWAEADAACVLLATGDKDLYQLVGEKVRVMPFAVKEALIGPEQVKTRTGVDPAQIADWLALSGDASDNIPGVPGVGPKTATKILAEHGSVANVLERLDEVQSEKLRKTLSESRELLARNLDVVRLRRDLGSPFDWDEMKVRPPDAGKLLPFFEELEFKAMVREMQQGDLFA